MQIDRRSFLVASSSASVLEKTEPSPAVDEESVNTLTPRDVASSQTLVF
ncbi:MAG TPA: hypothetical protein VM166_01710 [Gemmatimonadaceae bacterium]|nr:hypothetical protein [Gemmatimonadaceae bacterium]